MKSSTHSIPSGLTRLSLTMGTLMLSAGIPSFCHSQGYSVSEQDAVAMGRGGTGVAASNQDASAIFYNPAGLAGISGGLATVSSTLIGIRSSFIGDNPGQSADLDNPWLAVPQAYVAYGGVSGFAFGIGVFAPFGLETKWPTSFDGSFSGYKNILQNIYIQPTVAYRLTPGISLGGGVDIIAGSVELNEQTDLATIPVPLPGVPAGTTFRSLGVPSGTAFADAHIEASKTTFAGHIGAIVEINDRLSLGANFLSRAKFDFSGTASFKELPTGLKLSRPLIVGRDTLPAGTSVDGLLGGPAPGLDLFNASKGVFRSQPLSTILKNPAQLTVGLAYKAGGGLTVLGDYQYTWWDSFDAVHLNFTQDASGMLSRTLYEDYNNTSAYRLGIEWQENADWTFRAGYAHIDAAAPDQTVTPMLPEASGDNYDIGASIRLLPNLKTDIAYQYHRQDDRRGRTRDPIGNTVPTTAPCHPSSDQ